MLLKTDKQGQMLSCAAKWHQHALCVYCQTPDLGQGLEFDFTFANNNKNKNNNNDPHLNFPGWDGTRGLKFGTQT